MECLSIIGDCCRGTPLPSRNLLLSAVEPPRKEKRGSIRVANMIANKGLPVELEPVQGLVVENGEEAKETPSYSTLAAAAAEATAKVVGGHEEGSAGGGAAGMATSTSWVSSNAVAREKALGFGASGKVPRKSDAALGAAGKMRAETSSGSLALLDGFVPGPVTDMLAVSRSAAIWSIWAVLAHILGYWIAPKRIYIC